MKQAYNNYLDSDMYMLTDAYGRCSEKKRQAWRDCRKLMEEHDGTMLKVVSANTFMFTAGFVFEEDGIKKFAYITKGSTRIAVID